MNFKSFFQSEFIRNSSILISGNVIGQATAFLVLPLLTRMYTKADFGIFASFGSVTGLLAILGTGRYEESLVVAKDRKEATHLLGFSFRILSVFSLVLGVSFLFFRDFLFSVFHIQALSDFWYLIPFSVFFSGLFFLFSNLATREREFKAIASSNLIQNTTNSFLKVGIGALSFTQIGLMLSTVLSVLLSLLPFFKLKSYARDSLSEKWAEKRKKGIEFSTFPKHNVPRTFISSFSVNLPFLCLLSTFGEDRLGLFSLAFTLLYRPTNLLTNSLFTILFEKIVSLHRENKRILPILRNFCLKCGIYLLPCFVLVYFLAIPLFEFIFGKDWSESALYFQYLLPWIFVTMLAAPFQFIPILFQKQKNALWIESIYLLFRFAGLYIGIACGNFGLGILLFAAAGFIFTSIQLIWYYRLALSYEKSLV